MKQESPEYVDAMLDVIESVDEAVRSRIETDQMGELDFVTSVLVTMVSAKLGQLNSFSKSETYCNRLSVVFKNLPLEIARIEKNRKTN